jgi:hypothetical protein
MASMGCAIGAEMIMRFLTRLSLQAGSPLTQHCPSNDVAST